MCYVFYILIVLCHFVLTGKVLISFNTAKRDGNFNLAKVVSVSAKVVSVDIMSPPWILSSYVSYTLENDGM